MATGETYRRWAVANRERLRENHRRWREANRQKLRDLSREDHEANREKRNAKLRARKAERRAELDAFKRAQGCVDCGTSVGRMEFDHRPGETKDFNIAHGVGYSAERLWAEVAKCDVRCGTCHRKRHAG